MRCLVLGASGFIGAHLVKRLLNDGCEVVAYSRSSYLTQIYNGHPNLELLQGDFSSEQRWNYILKDVDVCYHLISTTVPKSSNDAPIDDVLQNLVGTLRLIEAAKHHSARVVFTSSGGTVYGVIESALISEDHATDPVCSYGISKLAIEKYLLLYRELHGLKSIVLRAANPYGGGQRPDAIQGAVGVFMGRIMRNQPIDLWGDGSVIRDYIYIDDLIEALVKASSYSGPHTIFNVGSGNGTSLMEIIQGIEIVSGAKANVVFRPARAFDVPRNVLDISRAAQAFGWAPEVSLLEGLQKTAESMYPSGPLIKLNTGLPAGHNDSGVDPQPLPGVIS